LKVATGGLLHEINTFNVRPTGLEAFKRRFGKPLSGKVIVSHFKGTATVIGKELTTAVGGKSDQLHGQSVEVQGRVKVVTDGNYLDPPQKTLASMGSTAVIRCGETDPILTEHLAMQSNTAPFLSVGVDPTKNEIVVVKSAHMFRQRYEKCAKPILEVDTPGITSPDLSRFVYRKTRHPIYPLDPT
jgi:microcystin degradation protein MlrC